MKAKVILNPTTGRGQGIRARARIEEELRRHRIAFDLTLTEGPGHATRLAQEAALSGVECVIAAGGDGTVNEVVNGLIAAARERNVWAHGEPAGTLGVIPIGSGNDFAFALGLRAYDIAGACARLAAGRSRLVDIACVEDDRPYTLYFCNNLGAGLDAAVNIESRKIKRLRGFPLYFVALLRTVLLYYRAPRTRVAYDRERLHMPVMMTSISNGPRTGGGFLIAPKARIDDGLLDLCVASQVSRLQILWLIPHFIRGTHEGKPPIRMLRADHIVIESEEGLPVHVDGEVFRTAAYRLDIRMWPRRLRVLA